MGTAMFKGIARKKNKKKENEGKVNIIILSGPNPRDIKEVFVG